GACRTSCGSVSRRRVRGLHSAQQTSVFEALSVSGSGRFREIPPKPGTYTRIEVARVRELELHMTKRVQPGSPGALIEERVRNLGDWRGKTLATVRELILEADPEIVEEWKWVKATNPGTPVWSHAGIVCTGETYKNAVKMTFAKGASLKDPARLFNSSLEGNVRRAIDIREGDKVDAAALTDLIRAAVALNLKGQGKAKAKRKTSKRRSSGA